MGRQPGETIGDFKKRMAGQKEEVVDPARELRDASRRAASSLGGLRRKSKLSPGRHKG